MKDDAAKKQNFMLETENRDLATKQVRRINDTLRKVRNLSRDSVRETPAAVTAAAPAPTHVVVQEVYGSRSRADVRRERDDSTDKFFLPEPSSETPLSDLFMVTMDLLEKECEGLSIALPGFAGSPVVRRWKIA